MIPVQVVVFMNAMVLLMCVVSTVWMESTKSTLQILSRAVHLAGNRVALADEASLHMHVISGENIGVHGILSLPEMSAEFVEDSNELAEVHDELFRLGEKGGELGFNYDVNFPVTIFQSTEDSTVVINRTVPLSSAGTYLIALVLRLSRMDPATLLHDTDKPDGTYDFRIYHMNVDTFVQASNQSFIRRQLDFVQTFGALELQLLYGGISGFILTVFVSATLFISLTRRIGQKTARTLAVLFHIPRGVAKALHMRSFARLQRTMATEQVQLLGDVGTEGLAGEQAAEEEARLMLEEDEAEQKLKVMLRRHMRAQANSRKRAGSGGKDEMAAAGVWVRPSVDTSRSVLRSSVRLIGPVLIVFVWLMTVMLVEWTQNAAAETHTYR